MLVGEAGGPNPDAGKGGIDGAEKANGASDQANADPHALVVHAPDKHADDDEPEVDDGDGKCPLPVEGTLRLGHMRAPRDTFEVFTNPDLADLLDRPILPPDTILEVVDKATVTILDADTHHWPEPPPAELLETYMVSVQPQPDAAWVSHGSGLKLAYIGPHHRDRAVAAALALPPSLKIEMLKHTRHPRSASTAHPGRHCGKIRFRYNDIYKAFTFRNVGRLTAELRQQALRQLGMQDGGRYGHERCPIDPGADTAAKECVVVLSNGVFCHRCCGHGTRYRPRLPAGFLPFGFVVNSNSTDLDRLADHWVHWTHARLELHHHHPNLSEAVLHDAYKRVLKAVHHEIPNDPRIHMVFNRDLDFVRGEAGWLSADTLQVTRMDDDAASGLPHVCVVITKDGETAAVVDRVRRAQLKHRTPRGYTPIRPVRGISFAPDDGVIPVLFSPGPVFPIRLLDNPMPEEEAFQILEKAFPGLNRMYLKACVAAGICAQAGNGQPPMLPCTGPSGSAKEQTIRLGDSFMGQDIFKVSLNEEDDKATHRLGTALAGGSTFICHDEIAKTRDLSGKIKGILAISRSLQWRPLYANHHLNTPVRAAIFFPTVRLPSFLTTSQKFRRRTRHTRLYRRVPNWVQTSRGDTAAWRDRTEENARVGNSILTHVWRLCHQNGFDFQYRVADALGLGFIDDDEPSLDPSLLREIYRYARNEDGKRVLFENDRSFEKGWVNLDAPHAADLVSPFVPLDEVEGVKQARRIARANLEARPWNDVLGIDTPPIRCVVRVHGSKWGLRFQSAEPQMRGRERLNEKLPPIADDGGEATAAATDGCEPPPPASPNPAAAASSTATNNNTTSTVTPNTAAEDVLKKAGMPA